MQFYTKNESGEVVPATEAQLEKLVSERSNGIVARRIAEIREKEVAEALAKAKPELETKLRDELTAKIKSEVESEFQPLIDEANKAKGEAELALRRKTVAAEYGFKPEAEEFLGNGSEEDMRAKADTLKNSFGSPNIELPDKKGGEPESESMQKYGLDVKI